MANIDITNDAIRLNVPKRLVDSAIANATLETIAAAAMIFAYKGDGRITDLSVKSLMKLFHCGCNRAKRILKRLKGDNDFFVYDDKKGTINVRSFKRHEGVMEYGIHTSKSGKFSKKYRSCYCLKLDISDKDSLSINNVIKQLRFLLISCMTKTKNVKDEFTKSLANNLTSPRSTRESELYQEKIGESIGVSQPTVSRYVRQMERLGLISIQSHKPIPIYNRRTGEMYTHDDVLLSRRQFLIKDCVCVRHSNEYQIINAKHGRQCCNIIFDHIRRLRFTPKPFTRKEIETESAFHEEPTNFIQFANFCNNPRMSMFF